MICNLIDNHNRHLNYLRISITDRCNLRCMYCMPNDRLPKLEHREILTYEEILRLVNIAVKLGITKVRITGGEPLVRRGVYGFLERLTAIPGIRDVSLTTNGLLLGQHMARLKEAGIKRLNISLDTLDRDKYNLITGYDHFDRVWENIIAAWRAGFAPLKLNMVVLKGVNDDELEKFAALSLRYPFHVRFIEYMPIGMAGIDPSQHVLTPEIMRRVGVLGRLEPVANGRQDGPARRFRLPGAPGEIGFISALSHHFCETCNRLRLTASGKLRACLLSDEQIDLREPLRKGCSDRDIIRLFRLCVQSKKAAHRLAENMRIKSQMSKIGG